MKTIYVDSEYKCHVVNETGEYISVTTDFFDGKCDQFIEGYRFIPAGCEWINTNGVVFNGKMITPWKSMTELDSIQLEYEKQLSAEYSSALSEIEAAISVPEVCGTTATIVETRKQNILTRINEIIETLAAVSST